MIETIKRYFQSWINNDIETVKDIFADNVIYTECYGPEYHGLKQIIMWFEDWNKKGKVIEWSVKRFIEKDDTIVIEWFFKCDYEGVIDGFDGITIADFDEHGKIIRLSEFQSKTDHIYPYD